MTDDASLINARSPEKIVILEQMRTIGHIFSYNVETAERAKFEDKLNSCLMAVYWLEVLAAPFLNNPEDIRKNIEENDGVSMKSKDPRDKIEFLRLYGRELIMQLHAGNLYFGKDYAADIELDDEGDDDTLESEIP